MVPGPSEGSFPPRPAGGLQEARHPEGDPGVGFTSPIRWQRRAVGVAVGGPETVGAAFLEAEFDALADARCETDDGDQVAARVGQVHREVGVGQSGPGVPDVEAPRVPEVEPLHEEGGRAGGGVAAEEGGRGVGQGQKAAGHSETALLAHVAARHGLVPARPAPVLALNGEEILDGLGDPRVAAVPQAGQVGGGSGRDARHGREGGGLAPLGPAMLVELSVGGLEGEGEVGRPLYLRE